MTVAALRAETPGRVRELGRAAVASPDLAVLCALLLLTAAFGRPFSKLGVADTIYVTEVALLVAAALALRRVGWRGALERIRRSVPVVVLLVFWLAGAIAGVRGLAGYGFSSSIRDAGLVEYSVLVPLAAVLVDTAAKARFFLRFLVVAGGVSGLVYVIVFFVVPDSPLGALENPTSAVGLYLALLILPVSALLAYRVRMPWWLVAVAALCLGMLALGAARSAVLAALVGFLALACFSPRPILVAIAGVGAVVAAVLIGAGLQSIDIGDREEAQIAAFAESLEPEAESDAYDNGAWRLEYWRYLIEETASNPVLGVGFGRAANFHYKDIVYDTRTGEDDLSVSPPHNSFVNVLYRTGLLGLVALVALVLIGAVRAFGLWRRGGPSERPWIAALLALLAFACVIASLNVALEGPFMGIVFWTIVGLTLVLPRIPGRAVSDP